MLKLIPTAAAVMALCACTAAPTLRFPTGSAARQPINAPSRPALAMPLPNSAAAGTSAARSVATSAAGVTTGRTTMPAAAVEAPPEPVPLKVFTVNANEQSAMEVLRRWARLARADFSWDSEVDYPVTVRMRSIHARELEAALDQLRASLAGVRAPLTITSTAEGLLVQAQIDPPVLELPVEAAASATAPVTPNVPATVARQEVGASRTSWPIGEQRMLREVLTDWAALGGVRLVWEAAGSQPLPEAARTQTYSGTFRESVAQLASSFGELATPLGMSFTDNGAALRVYDLESTK